MGVLPERLCLGVSGLGHCFVGRTFELLSKTISILVLFFLLLFKLHLLLLSNICLYYCNKAEKFA